MAQRLMCFISLLLFAALIMLAKCDTRAAEEEVLKSIFDPARNYNSFVRPPGSKNATLKLHDLPYEVKGEPVVVHVNMFVRHIGEINDDTKDFKISITLRQEWNDSRLSYTPSDPNLEYVTLTDESKIWTPDLFFSNEKYGDFHTLMSKNVLIRIKPRGEVLFSSRVSMALSCSMYFVNFPMDKQRCSIRMASYAYTVKDIIFVWKEERPIQAVRKFDIEPYTMDGFGIDYCNSKTNTGEYSCLIGVFLFARLTNAWIMDAYIPLGLLVIVSWIIFWLDERSVALRVVVIIVVLMTTIVYCAMVLEHVPKTGYGMAINTWINWIIVLVFLALIEQLVVTLMLSREPPAPQRCNREVEGGAMAMTPLMDGNGTEALTDADEQKQTAAPAVAPKSNLIKKWLNRFNFTSRRIDVACRVLFPIIFIIFNIIYWISCVNYEGPPQMSAFKKMQ